MKGRILIGLCLVLAALFAAACSPAPAPTAVPPTTAPQPTTAPAQPTAAPAEPTTAAAQPTTAAAQPTTAAAQPTAAAPAAEPTTIATRTASADEGTPLYGGTLVVARFPDLVTCNGALSTDVTASEIMGNIHDSLVRQNGSFEVVPELATSWSVSEDGKTITFKLRDDVKWHDGVPFTSADVKFTYENIISKLHARGRINIGDALESVETPDDYTAIFHMKEPRSTLLWQINGSESPIVAKHIFEGQDLTKGDAATCKTLPIGTGPFMASEYIPGESMTVVRNPDWWGTKGTYWGAGQPYLDSIVYTFIPDVTARVNCLETGQCGYVGMLMFPENEVERFKNMPGRDVNYDCTVQQIGVTNRYGLNLRNEILKDKRVRQALSLALDRDAINQQVYFGNGTPSATFVPPGHPWYSPSADKYLKRDLDTANKLLDEAGYPKKADGTRFELNLVTDTRSTQSDLGKAFQLMLADVGVKVNLEILEFPAMTEKVYMQHDFDVWAGVNGVGADPFGTFLATANIGDALFNNSAGYSNPEMDELISQFRQEFDLAKQNEIMHKMVDIASEDVPYIEVMNTLYPLGINTDEYAGYATDATRCDVLMRNIWWKKGRPTP